MADLAGLAAKLNTEAVISANKGTINPVKAQIGDGTDTLTTAQTLQSLSTDEQLAITQDNQALLNANEVQRVEGMESGDKVWDQPGVSQGIWRTQQKDCRKAGVSSSDCSAYIWARSVSRAKNIASILVPTSPEEVVFLVATAGGGYVLKAAGKAGVKVVRSFRSKKELDEAVAEAKRVSKKDTPNGYEPDNNLLSSPVSGRREIPTSLIGKDFEDWLRATHGGKGSFSLNGREFDGAITPTRWYEAKSGNYWQNITSSQKGLQKFQSDMAARQKIAKDHGATYELHSNIPIPQNVKDWLDKKGIKYYQY